MYVFFHLYLIYDYYNWLMYLGDMLHSNISPIVSVRIFISIYLSLFITVWILFLDYLKKSYDYDFQILTVSLALPGIVYLPYSAWSLNHDVI